MDVQSEYMLGCWHYIHKAFSSVYNPELPLVQRRLVPELAHRRTRQRSPSKPPANQVHNYEKSTANTMPGASRLFVPGSIFSLMESSQHQYAGRPTRGFARRLARRRGLCSAILSRYLIRTLVKCPNRLGSVKGGEEDGIQMTRLSNTTPTLPPVGNLCSGGVCVIEVLLARARVAP